jgi:hypothetical protein
MKSRSTGGIGLICGVAMFSIAALSASAAQTPGPSAVVRAFAAFLGQSAPVCLREAARRCVDAGWRFADRNRDGRLTLGEFEAVRRELREWLAWPENGIAPHERRGVLVGLMVVEAIGLPRLFASYDANGDGTISRAELLADVRLDDRPLGKVLSDTNAVDWASVRQRLGALAPALGNIAPTPAPE